MKKISLIGQKFGRLTVLEEAEPYISPKGVKTICYKCVCDCGNTIIAKAGALRFGTTKSCGCLSADSKHKRGRTLPEDITGQVFGHLTVIKMAGSNQNGKTVCECRCDCGEQKAVLYSRLVSGQTKSCGSDVHKCSHGKRNTRLYKVFIGMKGRCYNPKNEHYTDYGGRGIKICDEWLNDFDKFYQWAYANGYDETAPKGQYTIERIDVNGSYCPENCRWATIKEQQYNKRDNVIDTYNGETMTATEFAEKYNIKKTTLWGRLKAGWKIEKAIETPTRKSAVGNV